VHIPVGASTSGCAGQDTATRRAQASRPSAAAAWEGYRWYDGYSRGTPSAAAAWEGYRWLVK
jgi:hypothetical protein